MFINDAFAAAADANMQINSSAGTLIQLGLIILIFYIFIIRPQKKRINEHNAMVNALKVGDNIYLSNGIYGKITKIKDDKLSVEIAPNVEVVVDRMTVGAVIAEDKKSGNIVSKAEKANKKVKKGK